MEILRSDQMHIREPLKCVLRRADVFHYRSNSRELIDMRRLERTECHDGRCEHNRRSLIVLFCISIGAGWEIDCDNWNSAVIDGVDCSRIDPFCGWMES